MTKNDFMTKAEETKAKLAPIFADEASAEKLFQLETPEEVQSYLKQYDVDMTVEQIKAMKELFAAIMDGKISQEELKVLESGEIPERLLAEVSGAGEFCKDEFSDNVVTGGIGAFGGAITSIATICLTTGPVGITAAVGLFTGAAVAIGFKYLFKLKW